MRVTLGAGVPLGALCTLVWLLAPSNALAQRSGHGGGGHAGGGHAGGGHASGGQAGGSHAGSGHAGPILSVGGTGSAGGSGPSGHAHPAPPHGTAGPSGPTAIPGTNSATTGSGSTQTSPFTATATTYAPVFVSPHFSRVRLGVFPFVHTYGGYLAPSYPICDSALDCAPPLNSGYAETAELEVGTVRLDVQPLFAQVFVDDYYVGTVDDFFRSLSGLNVAAGPHRVEFRAPGFETVSVNMMIEAGRAITYRASLKREPPQY